MIRFPPVSRFPILAKGSLQKSPLSRDFRELEILEILENPQAVGGRGEPERVVEFLENLKMLEIL